MLKTTMLAGLAIVMFGLPAVPALAEAGATAPLVDVETLARQCWRAYGRQDQAFLLRHCPEEAWSLARAQCERGEETVAPAYAEFCHLFHSGQAPSYGR